MKLFLLDIPEDDRELKLWLERHIIGLDLASLAAELSVIHENEPADQLSLEEAFQGQLDQAVAQGLTLCPREVIQRLLSHPQLLLDFQERVLLSGGEYWQKAIVGSPSLAEAVERQRAQLRPLIDAVNERQPTENSTRQPWLAALRRLVTAFAPSRVIALGGTAAILLIGTLVAVHYYRQTDIGRGLTTNGRQESTLQHSISGSTKSGPQVGERLPGPFFLLNVTGPHAGEKYSFFEEAAHARIAMIFARDISEPLQSVVDTAEVACSRHGMKGYVIVLSDEEGVPDRLKRLAAEQNIKHVVFSVCDGNGPARYKLAKDAELTVILCDDQMVKHNYGLSKSEMTAAQIDAIKKGIVEFSMPASGAGDQRETEVYTAFAQAEGLQSNGDYHGAARHYKWALALALHVFGEEHLNTAAILCNLANCSRKLGQYAEAERRHRRSLDIRETKLGTDHPEVADSLYNLGTLYSHMGKDTKAHLHYQRCLKIREAKLGTDHPEVADCLHGMAFVYARIGQHDDAEPLYKRCLEIREAKLGANHPKVADSLNALGSLYRHVGQYSKAVALYKRRLEILEARPGKDHLQVTQALDNLGNAYVELGQHAEAEPLYRRSLEIRETKLGLDHPNVADSLNYLGTLHKHIGQYSKAERLYQRSLEIREASLGKDHLQVAQSLNNLANLYVDLAQHRKAEQMYCRSLEIREVRLGKDHSHVADSLNNLGILYVAMGQYLTAEPLYLRSLRIYEAHKDHLKVAVSLNNLATLYQALCQYAKSEELYQRSLDIKEAQLGKDHVDVALCLQNQASLYQEKCEYAKSEELYKRSLGILELKLGRNDLKVASTLANLAELYRSMADYSNAQRHSQRSVEIFGASFGKESIQVTDAQLSLANLYSDLGQYDRAECLYLGCLRAYETQLGNTHPEVARCLFNLASLYQDMGQHGRAEELYKRSLDIREATFGKEHLNVADSVSNLASLYLTMGQYAKADALYLRCLAIVQARLGKDHLKAVPAMGGLAALHAIHADYATAEQFYLRSLEIREDKLGKDHPEVARSLQALGWLYDNTDRPTKAEPFYQRSLQIRELKLGKSHPDVAESLHGIAVLCRDAGNYGMAERLFRRSLDIREATFGKNDHRVASSLSGLATLHARLGQYAKAEPLCRRSLDIRQAQPGNDWFVANALHNLAYVCAAQDGWAEAGELAARERSIVARHVAHVLPGLTDQEQLRFLELADARHLRVALSMGLKSGLPELVTQSAGWLLNAKGVAHQCLAEQALLVRAASDPAAKPLAGELRAVRQQLAALTVAPPKAVEQDWRQKELPHLAEREQDLSHRLAQALGRPLRDDPSVSLEEVRHALPDNAVLVDIARFNVANFEAKLGEKQSLGYHYVAWIIPPAGKGDVQLVDLKEAEPIDRAIAEARGKFDDIGQYPDEAALEKELVESLQTLSKLVLEPIRDHAGSCERWYVSPDASLWLVPWGALPLADGRYAVEQYQISYLISGRDLVTPAPTAEVTRPKVMADPAYDVELSVARALAPELLDELRKDQADRVRVPGTEPGAEKQEKATGGSTEGTQRSSFCSAPTVRPLDYTAEEAEKIKGSLEKYAGQEARIYKGSEAQKAVFEALRSPKVLVLATHGCFLEDQEVQEKDRLLEIGHEAKGPLLTKAGKPLQNPLLRCSLLLAGYNNRKQAKLGEDNGVLTGLEIIGTDLRGTELVVLSACETGLGGVHNGEGVASLRQAFQLAGAQAVLATYWRIPDKEAAELMTSFFDNLAASKPEAKDRKAEALCKAQRAMIQKRRQADGAAHPYYWAAYTLTGK
jgi:tetratricopeptide (TPR) repeat protein/CHAT domain-containing protein